MSFESLRKTTGALGEMVFAKHLMDRGYLVYGLLNGFVCPKCNERSFNEGTYHPFDFFCVKPYERFKFDFSDCFIAEVKVKTREAYPNEVGMNLSDYNDYLKIARQTNIPFWIVFVQKDGIYATTLEELSRIKIVNEIEYPKHKIYHYKENEMVIEKHVVFSALSAMTKIGELSENEKRKFDRVTSEQSTLKMPRASASIEHGH